MKISGFMKRDFFVNKSPPHQKSKKSSQKSEKIVIEEPLSLWWVKEPKQPLPQEEPIVSQSEAENFAKEIFFSDDVFPDDIYPEDIPDVLTPLEEKKNELLQYLQEKEALIIKLINESIEEQTDLQNRVKDVFFSDSSLEEQAVKLIDITYNAAESGKKICQEIETVFQESEEIKNKSLLTGEIFLSDEYQEIDQLKEKFQMVYQEALERIEIDQDAMASFVSFRNNIQGKGTLSLSCESDEENAVAMTPQDSAVVKLTW